MADRKPILNPGLQSTSGDRIILALNALLGKIRELERAQASEAEQRDVGTNTDDPRSMSSMESHRSSEHSLIQEMRLNLVTAQLHSVQCFLQMKYPRSTRNAETNTENVMLVSAQAANDNTRAFDDGLDQIPENLTPTESSHRGSTSVTPPEPFRYISSSDTSDLISRNENHQLTGEKPIIPEPAVRKTKPCIPSSRSNNESSLHKHRHFHLKLSNVPFILGTSTSASHSLTANVQTIIGALKTHNALCLRTPSPVCPRFNALQEQRKKENDAVLKNLSKDFSKLSMKQKQLKEQLSENRGRREKKAIHDHYKSISDLLQSKAQEIVDFHTQVVGKSSEVKVKGKTQTKP